MKHQSLLILIILTIASCGPNNKNLTEKIIPVNPAHFIQESLLEPITTEEYKLSNGTTTECYKLVVRSIPHEHKMGPWCPTHIKDSKEQGGIWFEDGKVYDVDGHFISNIGEFYADAKWNLYNEDGSIKVTKTQKACEGAAKPNVEEIYKNHCVECQPSFYHDHITTYYIPINPIYQTSSTNPRRGIMGLAFNGVNFDPPAPTQAILNAHTLAPLDDCGGHVNPHVGYHYHAVNGCTKEIEQSDGHAPMVGYAIDGFGIYAAKDSEGNKSTNLDPCGGHEDKVRGYHYHAGAPGSNQILGCLNGEYGKMIVSH
ncbi:MAG: YHYH protein [Saprospiraceae bacterium]